MKKIKNAVMERNNAFDGLISRLDSLGKTLVWGYLNRNCQKWKTERKKKQQQPEYNIQELWDNHKRCQICVMEI